ncbi:MAG: C4-type zinc ribbon domain-containing protein [Actinomycetota bacterium]|nr:C4-type zinc ribbon domain-containing protein [Actinomycetota bacterium]
MPIRADASALERLLQLQSEDSSLDRSRRRLDQLPERAKLEKLEQQLEELSSDAAVAERNRDDVARVQDRLEGEISVLEQKLQREQHRMYSGQVANPKELSNLQAEVEMLSRRRGGLEDELLDSMVARDGAVSTLQALTTERDELSSSVSELQSEVARLSGEIEAELEERLKARDELRSGLPEDLVLLYEKIRSAKGGVGAAVLERGTCQGCHTRLPAREVERLRAEGGLQRCDNCRRILVVQ